MTRGDEKKKIIILKGRIYSGTFCRESNDCRDLVVSNNGEDGEKEIKLAFSDDCKQTNKIIDDKGNSVHEDFFKIAEQLKEIDEKEENNG